MYIERLRAGAPTSDMIAFVKQLLTQVDMLGKTGRSYPFRSRYLHTERVTEHALRLAETEGGDAGVIAVAGIFHDSGYSRSGEGHAVHSEKIFREYIEMIKNAKLATKGDGRQVAATAVKGDGRRVAAPTAVKGDGRRVAASTAEGDRRQVAASTAEGDGRQDAARAVKGDGRRVAAPTAGANTARLLAAAASAISSVESLELICSVIADHSKKDIFDINMPVETKILIDADLLDEAGAITVLFDCFDEALLPAFNYESAYRRMSARYDETASYAERFLTAEGKRRYIEMRRNLGMFLNDLKSELFL